MKLDPIPVREWAARSYSREFVSCARKVLILTAEEARAQAVRMQTRYGQVFVGYECKFCGAYHVGRIGERAEKKIEKNRQQRVHGALTLMQPYWVKLWGEK